MFTKECRGGQDGRRRLIEYNAAHIQHMQKALTQMNVQLHHVVTDITGVTGMRIIRAIVAGERDPNKLAQERDCRCKASEETIRDGLTCNYRAEHLSALRHSLETPSNFGYGYEGFFTENTSAQNYDLGDSDELDDQILREAIQNVAASPEWTADTYRALPTSINGSDSHNCLDFACFR